MFSYELGGGPVKIESGGKTFDDDQWHKVHFERAEKKGDLLVDDVHRYSGEARGKLNKLDTTGNIFIGQYSVSPMFDTIYQYTWNTWNESWRSWCL